MFWEKYNFFFKRKKLVFSVKYKKFFHLKKKFVGKPKKLLDLSIRNFWVEI